MAKEDSKGSTSQGSVYAAEAERLNKIRRTYGRTSRPIRTAPTGNPEVLGRRRAVRERKRITWYAVAKAAGIPNPATVRNIEYGRDTKLSSIEAIATALGLKLDLVEAERNDSRVHAERGNAPAGAMAGLGRVRLRTSCSGCFFGPRQAGPIAPRSPVRFLHR